MSEISQSDPFLQQQYARDAVMFLLDKLLAESEEYLDFEAADAQENRLRNELGRTSILDGVQPEGKRQVVTICAYKRAIDLAEEIRGASTVLGVTEQEEII